MHLDLTITLGNIISGAGTIAAVVVAYMKIRDRLIVVETRLEPLWSEWVERQSRRR